VQAQWLRHARPCDRKPEAMHGSFFFTLLLNFDSIIASQQDKASLCADMGSALFQSAATILMLAVVLFVLQKHLNKYIKKLAGHFRRPRCEETGHESPCLVRKVVLFLGV
jgi:hypothetical protein